MRALLIESACGCFQAAMNTPIDGASLRLLHGARRRRTQGACSPLPPALQPGTCRCVWLCVGAAMQAPTDGASLRLLHGARRTGTQGACLSLRPALGFKVLVAPIRYLQCVLQWSRHKSPTGGASLRLLHGARRTGTQGACSSLPPTLGCKVLAALIRHLH